MFSPAEASRVNYATATITLSLLLTRIVLGRIRRKPLDLAFFLLLASVVAITSGVALSWYVLHLGTANNAVGNPEYSLTHDAADVRTGSRCILAARVSITTTLWLQIGLLLLFYTQILQGIPWVKFMIRLTWLAAGLSYLAVLLATFLECRPLSQYWRLDPPPGECAKAYAQLLSQCISNIILDLMLLTISFPIMTHRGRSWTQSIRVGAVFTLGTFCLVVTILRLTAIYSTQGAQAARTLWGSVQMIVSSFVANTPTVYGDIHIILKKRQEAKTRRTSRPESWVRSDFSKENDVENQAPDDDAGKEDLTFSDEIRPTNTTTTMPGHEREIT